MWSLHMFAWVEVKIEGMFEQACTAGPYLGCGGVCVKQSVHSVEPKAFQAVAAHRSFGWFRRMSASARISVFGRCSPGCSCRLPRHFCARQVLSSIVCTVRALHNDPLAHSAGHGKLRKAAEYRPIATDIVTSAYKIAKTSCSIGAVTLQRLACQLQLAWPTTDKASPKSSARTLSMSTWRRLNHPSWMGLRCATCTTPLLHWHGRSA